MPEVSNHLSCQTLAGSWYTDKSDPFWSREPIVPCLVSKRTFAKAEPFFQNSEPPHIILSFCQTVKLQGIGLAQNVLFISNNCVNIMIVKSTMGYYCFGK